MRTRLSAKRILDFLRELHSIYGDPLYDIANVYFWSPWLECMRIQTEYFQSSIAQTHDYRNRLLCYQLRIGILEIHENAVDNDSATLDWATGRTVQLLKTIKA